MSASSLGVLKQMASKLWCVTPNNYKWDCEPGTSWSCCFRDTSFPDSCTVYTCYQTWHFAHLLIFSDLFLEIQFLKMLVLEWSGCVKEATIPCHFFKENTCFQLNKTKDKMKDKSHIFAEVLYKFDKKCVLVGIEIKTYTITPHHQCYLQKAWSWINLWRPWRTLELQQKEHMGKPK